MKTLEKITVEITVNLEKIKTLETITAKEIMQEIIVINSLTKEIREDGYVSSLF